MVSIQTDCDYKKKIRLKAVRWFSEYLKRATKGISTDEARRRVIAASLAVFRTVIGSNEKFFDAMAEFCSVRRTVSEKNAFFDVVMSQMRTYIKEELDREVSDRSIGRRKK